MTGIKLRNGSLRSRDRGQRRTAWIIRRSSRSNPLISPPITATASKISPMMTIATLSMTNAE